MESGKNEGSSIDLIRGVGDETGITFTKLFILRMRYNFDIKVKQWPTITAYHELMSKAIQKGNLENEAHVWLVLLCSKDDDKSIEAFRELDVKPETLGDLLREGILSSYPSIMKYTHREDSAIKRAYAMRIIKGGSLPRRHTLTRIMKDIGYINLFDLVKHTIGIELSEMS